MYLKCDVLGETGLQFFGKMCASMSHEIKNALAIIQEHAGLLDDFTVMVKEGIPINPQRVKVLAEKIQGQINRADGIVKGLNRLAHSVDESVYTVDLVEVLRSLVALSHRLASVRGVTVKAKPLATKVTIRTSPFFLQNLTWLCLDFAMDVTGDKKTVHLSAEKTKKGAEMRFTELEGLGDEPPERFLGTGGKALLILLKAEIATHIGEREIVLALPGDIDR
jgi:signal transduction histidine kinase